MVTQTEIARRLGLDVSSVNKIINQVPGPVFNKNTIQKVERAVREFGYKVKPNSRGQLIRALSEIRAVLLSPGSYKKKVFAVRKIMSRVDGKV